MKGFLSMAGLALVAYVVGRQSTEAVLGGSSHRLADLERRLASLEASNRGSDDAADLSATEPDPRRDARKQYTAFHYEALANQAAHERKMAELDWRLAEIEWRRHASRSVRCASRQTAGTGDRHRG